ncbi:MAG: diaminopimelate decarboxylase [Clostridia bacterium]|nr:diaminopimelate decarboxylase [Clostridia bacterium]
MLHPHYSINSLGHLAVGGVDTVALAEKYGTPLYVIDENAIRAQCRLYKSAMEHCFGTDSTIHYASKALSCKAIYRILQEEGIGVDLVSPGELYTAKAAGFDLTKASFHGNNKTDREIENAILNGIGEFMVDSFEELEAIDRIAGEQGVMQRIMLRLTPNIDAHTQKAILTGQLDSKFGTPIATGQAERLVRLALCKKNLVLEGFHSHIGSQIFEYEPYIEQAKVMFEFMADMKQKTGYEAKKINLGGGFAVRYTHDQPSVDIVGNIEKICAEVDRLVAQYKLNRPAILMEPGRSIVAAAGVTLYTVGTVKEIEGVRTYVSVDGGMTDNPRYALYQSRYEALLANRAAEKKDLICTIAGRCCESGDLIGEGMALQTPVRGDILAVPVTGAYNYSMASNYNRVPRPAMVFVADGKDRQVIRRETYEDLCRNDI